MSKQNIQTTINYRKDKPFTMTYRFPAEGHDYTIQHVSIDIVDITVAILSGFKYLWIDRHLSNVRTNVVTSFYGPHKTLNKVFRELYITRNDEKKLPLL